MSARLHNEHTEFVHHIYRRIEMLFRLALLFAASLAISDWESASKAEADYRNFAKEVQERGKRAYEHCRFESIVHTNRSIGIETIQGVEFRQNEVLAGKGWVRRCIKEPSASQDQWLVSVRQNPDFHDAIWFGNMEYIALMESSNGEYYLQQEVMDFRLNAYEPRGLMPCLDFYPPVLEWLASGTAKCVNFSDATIKNRAVKRLDLERTPTQGYTSLQCSLFFDADHGACILREMNTVNTDGATSDIDLEIQYRVGEEGIPIPTKGTFNVTGNNKIHLDEILYENFTFSPEINPDKYYLKYYGLREPTPKNVAVPISNENKN
jgi:hypothetical protein